MATDARAPEGPTLAALAEEVARLRAEVASLREPEDEATRWRHGEREPAPAFKVGDRVAAVRCPYDVSGVGCNLRPGDTGTVIEVRSGNPSIGVKWDRDVNGHNGGCVHCPDGHGWFVNPSDLAPLAPAAEPAPAAVPLTAEEIAAEALSELEHAREGMDRLSPSWRRAIDAYARLGRELHPLWHSRKRRETETAGLRAEVERLTRERAEAIVAAECSAREAKFERERANEWLTQKYDAERSRDKAADVAREAIAGLTIIVAGTRQALAGRLRAALSALSASPAPAPDPLAGMPEADRTEILAAVLAAATPLRDPRVYSESGDYIAQWVSGGDDEGRVVALAWHAGAGRSAVRLLRVAPDGAITREATP